MKNTKENGQRTGGVFMKNWHSVIMLMFVALMSLSTACDVQNTDWEEYAPIVHPRELNFGEVDAGSSKDLPFIIQNEGDLDLVGEVVLGECEAGFSLVDDDDIVGSIEYNLSPSEHTSIMIRFTNDGIIDPGLYECDIDTGIESQGVFCNARALEIVSQCAVHLPNPIYNYIDFGDVPPGVVKDSYFAISNEGEFDLEFEVTLDPQDIGFSVSATDGESPLAPGESATVFLEFENSGRVREELTCVVSLGTECDGFVLKANAVDEPIDCSVDPTDLTP